METIVMDNGDISIFVRNAKKTTNDKADDGSNLDRWKQYAKVEFPECSRLDIKDHKGDIVGAHIVILGEDENDEFIIPLCSHCNKQPYKEEFPIKDKVYRMPAKYLHDKVQT